MAKQFWLMKCEPTSYSIDDLKRDVKTGWEGVRNYQARNFIRDKMSTADEAIFYHSNGDPSGAAGVMKICGAGYPDPFAFDPKHKYFDADSDPENPCWYTVDVQFAKKFPKVVPLSAIKENPKLKGIMVAKKGSRLSVQPLSREHFQEIVKMGGI